MSSSSDYYARGLFAGVNEPAGENLSDFEAKHVPDIDAPDTFEIGGAFAVTVEVGRGKRHPNERDHFVRSVELYADDTFLARADLSSVSVEPRMTFTITLQHEATELRAYEHCTLHGVWLGRKPLTVAS